MEPPPPLEPSCRLPGALCNLVVVAPVPRVTRTSMSYPALRSALSKYIFCFSICASSRESWHDLPLFTRLRSHSVTVCCTLLALPSRSLVRSSANPTKDHLLSLEARHARLAREMPCLVYPLFHSRLETPTEEETRLHCTHVVVCSWQKVQGMKFVRSVPFPPPSQVPSSDSTVRTCFLTSASVHAKASNASLSESSSNGSLG